jgi:hypothetical protein
MSSSAVLGLGRFGFDARAEGRGFLRGALSSLDFAATSAALSGFSR